MVPLIPRSARFQYVIRDARKIFRLTRIVCIVLTFQRNAHSLIWPKYTITTVEANMESFRFLDLPKEVRLIVYEQLSIVRRHTTVQIDYTHPRECYGTLVHHVLPLTILRVSKMIHHEAYAIVKPRLYDILLQPPRVIIHAPFFIEIAHDFSHWLNYLKNSIGMPESSHPALLQWAQHASLYYGSKNDHPFLVRFARDNPSAPRKTARMQLLISQLGNVLRMRASLVGRHDPLHHILAEFLEQQLSVNYPNDRVDLCLTGTSVRKTSFGSVADNYSSQHLQDELSAAYRRARMRNRGKVVELADWENDWEATPENRM